MMSAPIASPSVIGRLSSWFGANEGRNEERSAAGSFEYDPRRVAQQLFASIGDFLALHDLEPTEAHFAIARSYVLGDDTRLKRAMERQLRDGGRLDAGFVDRITGRGTLDPLHPERIADMADVLAMRLADTEHTFRLSHDSARDYQTALHAEAHAAETDPGGMVERLLILTGEAIARTQQLASRLEETARETTQLRDNLHEAQRAADEDHLTGLPNRRCFDGRLHRLVVQGREAPQHCVALCDVDDFKAINDRHGHDTGDRVLKLIAQHLSGDLGEDVLVARHGGEEFGCLFERCTPAAALARLDGVRERLSTRALVNQASGEGIGRMTFSAGVAPLGIDIAATMRAADGALYAAKRAGKNRILVAAG